VEAPPARRRRPLALRLPDPYPPPPRAAPPPDAPWPERLLLHKNASVESAATLAHRRAVRRQRWQDKLAETSQAAAAAAGTGGGAAPTSAAGPAGGAAAAPGAGRAGGVTSPGEHAAAVEEMEGSIGSLTDSGPLLDELRDAPGEPSGRPAAALAAGQVRGVQGVGMSRGASMCSTPGLQRAFAAPAADNLTLPAPSPPHRQAPNQALFRGLRVRMSLATGRADEVRLHTVTQRHEYSGSVLRRVQAVGETPHGGQVGGRGGWWGRKCN
jgi:hypothetical protein